jgi:hypothetical protein
VDPLLCRIEALNDIGGSTRAGDYAALFRLPDGSERTVLLTVVGSAVSAPAANLIPGWPAESDSFQAVLAAVLAMHQARGPVGQSHPSLRDLPGGWDVGLGNVTLSSNGVPSCVSHGELAPSGESTFECPECGARAFFAAAI